MSKPHEPAPKVGGDKQLNEADAPLSEGYPDIPTDEPGLVGGPATEAVPGSHRHAAPLPGQTDDGGESILAGRPRETGGERPPKKIPKTEGS